MILPGSIFQSHLVVALYAPESIQYPRRSFCCSIACEEAVTDAKENINWLRVKDSELHAELHEFEEKLC